MPNNEDSEPLSVAVIRAVASAEGTSPTELDEPLANVIDPDALDSLFEQSGSPDTVHSDRVVFHYCGYVVTVYRDGEIAIRET